MIEAVCYVFSISQGVMPPDEYAQSVNNSVFTNVLAQKSILFARYAACLNDLDYAKEINDSLILLAKKLFIPFNKSSQYHPEFEGYESYGNGKSQPQCLESY